MTTTVEIEPEADRLLMKRATRGALVGGAVVFALALVLLGSQVPEVGLAGRIGTALYLSFWIGPFFGMVGGIGLHHLRLHQLEAAETGASVAVPTGGRVELTHA